MSGRSGWVGWWEVGVCDALGPTCGGGCGHGMGPMMAVGAAKNERCAERGGIGPFPYVAGTLEVLSMPLAEYMVEQDYVGSTRPAYTTGPRHRPTPQPTPGPRT